ncbi:MAG: hydrogenase maturation nickel metallochaperone HypA [Muribaculaceae bacterium]|nr:hydrogenase maturation nickel metallochaperone HypA [Muribaculaceae bacterium]
MHEMSLAMSVAEIAESTMAQYPGKRLTAIELTIGEMAGVEMNAFRTAIDAVIRTSRWPDAVAEFNMVEAESCCIECGTRFRPRVFFDSCPACGSGACSVVAGMEFRVSALRME